MTEIVEDISFEASLDNWSFYSDLECKKEEAPSAVTLYKPGYDYRTPLQNYTIDFDWTVIYDANTDDQTRLTTAIWAAERGDFKKAQEVAFGSWGNAITDSKIRDIARFTLASHAAMQGSFDKAREIAFGTWGSLISDQKIRDITRTVIACSAAEQGKITIAEDVAFGSWGNLISDKDLRNFSRLMIEYWC